MSKQYTDELKQEAIRLATTSPQPISKTARDFGVKETTLYYWINVAKSNAPSISNDQVNLIEELNRLRKENTHLKE